jgi:hypothetical protein
VSDKTTPESEFEMMRKLAPAFDIAALQARVEELEAAIRAHRTSACNGATPSKLTFADHRKLWSLLPD